MKAADFMKAFVSEGMDEKTAELILANPNSIKALILQTQLNYRSTQLQALEASSKIFETQYKQVRRTPKHGDAAA